jgi:hypothetical protein
LFVGRVILFGRAELAGFEGNRVPFSIEILFQDCTEGATGSIGGDTERKAGAEYAEDGGSGESGLEGGECFGAVGIPVEGCILGEEGGDWASDVRKILDEPAIEVG